MRRVFCFYFLLMGFCTLYGQKVQWASEVIDFSSEYLQEGCIATQVLGPPNSMQENPSRHLAWGPRQTESITGDFIHVGFAQAIAIRQVAVAESLHPGAISRIILYYTDGEKEKIYENKFPRAILAPHRLFQTTFELTSRKVEAVRIDLKTKAVNGRNMIDAIAIASTVDPIDWEQQFEAKKGKLSEAESLGEAINSPFSERLPIISPDGNTLYFARKDHPQNMGEENNDDIWVSFQEADGTWTKAVNVGAPLNNRQHNFVIAVSPTNDRLYLANEYNSQASNGVSMTHQNGRIWSEPKALEIDDHYNYSPFVSYHLNLDETILLMAVDRKDSYGDMDIYVSFLENDGRWTAPKNLGPDINTGDVESSIFIAADNKTIYFSSNGRDGFGGLDMYQSRRLDDTWTKWSPPQNLGSPINGPGNDYNYSIPASGEYAYFSSENADGNADLFRISLPEDLLPEPVALLKGNVIDAITKEPIKATLRLQNLDNAADNRQLEAQENGTYQVVLPVGENVGLVAERDGYFSVSEAMELTDQSLEELDGDQQTYAQVDGPISFNAAAAEQLRLELNELDTELRELEKRKTPKKIKRDPSIARQAYYQSDPELDALRHRYNKALRKEDHRPKKEELTKKGGEKESVDSELEEMKRKFNLYNKKKKTEDEEYLDLEVGRGEVRGIGETEEVEEDYGFTDLQAKIWEELETELEKEVRLELRKSLINEVEKAVERKLKPSLNLISRNRLRQYVVDMNRSVRKELKALQAPGTEYLGRTPMERVEKEMRYELEPKVRRHLRKTWRRTVRQVMQAELEYRFKKEEETKIRRKLQSKQKKEIKEERRNKNRQLTEESPEPQTNKTTTKPLEYQEVQKNILLLPIKKGQILPMNNVFFDANKASLKSQSSAELERIVQFLEKNKKLVVEVGGHTNGWCSHVFADKLSQDRAKAVAQYFIDREIDQQRIRFQGYGKKQPIATNDTPEGRKKNQRVELKILEIME